MSFYIRKNGVTKKLGSIPKSVVGSVFTGTLTAGSTMLVISDNDITTDSMIDIYTTVYGLNPTNVVVANGSITLTFEAQQSNVGVKVRVI